MFGIEFFDPKTVWINLTNLALGLVTLFCVLAVAFGLAQEVYERLQKRIAATTHADDHAFAVPGLGLTMADGGEKLADEEKKKQKET